MRTIAGMLKIHHRAVLTLLFAMLAVPLFGQDAKPKKADPAKASDKAKGNPAAAKSLFDGKSLDGWSVTDFSGHGEVKVENGQLMLEMGLSLTGVTLARTNDLPRSNYEVSIKAMKIDGSDFFLGVTFPVAKSHCTLVLGGWGGAVVGISSIDGSDASENDTTKFMKFEKKKWYDVRIKVTNDKIEAWLDEDKIVDADIKDRKVSMRPGEIELNEPFGLANYQTTTVIKEIKLRRF
jgi:hypothetical protein